MSKAFKHTPVKANPEMSPREYAYRAHRIMDVAHNVLRTIQDIGNPVSIARIKQLLLIEARKHETFRNVGLTPTEIRLASSEISKSVKLQPSECWF